MREPPAPARGTSAVSVIGSCRVGCRNVSDRACRPIAGPEADPRAVFARPRRSAGRGTRAGPATGASARSAGGFRVASARRVPPWRCSATALACPDRRPAATTSTHPRDRVLPQPVLQRARPGRVACPPVSTTAQYTFSTRFSRNCSLSRAAALLVRANRRTPETGLSSRWTTPRNTLPGLRVFFLQVCLDDPVHRLVRAAEVALGQPARLVHRDQVVVLVQDVERVGEGHGTGLRHGLRAW